MSLKAVSGGVAGAITSIPVPINQGGTGQPTASAALTALNAPDVYVPSGATDVQIQAAHDAVFAAVDGSNFTVGTVHLQPGGTYTINNPLIWQCGNVSLNGHGAQLNCSGLSNAATALTLTNTLGFPTNGSFATYGGRISDFYIFGDSTQGPLYNTMTGILVQGVPLLSITLNGTITAGATSLVISSASNFPTTAVSVKIDSEIILLAAGSGTTRNITTRGYLGTVAASHTSGVSILTTHEANPIIENVSAAYFNKALSIGDSSFALACDNFQFFASGYGIYAASASNTFQAENIRFNDGVVFGCNLGIYAEHQILRFYGTSIDYNNQNFICNLGSAFEFYGCHFEWNYGQTAGQTTTPNFITGADSFVVIEGGMINYTGSGLAFYNSHFFMDNASQILTIRDCRFSNLGKFQTATSFDALVMNADNVHQIAGNVGNINTSGNYAANFSLTDIPSAVCYVQQGNWLRSGTGDPYTELRSRIAVTGSAVIGTQAGSDGTVTPLSGASMMSISGQGVVYITFPWYLRPMVRTMWSFFLNTAEIGGTVTVTEMQCTCHPVWNGTNSISFVEDPRTNTTGTITLSGGLVGSNTWQRMSWKGVSANPLASSRFAEYFAIKIDTTAMTGTNLYLDVFGIGVT